MHPSSWWLPSFLPYPGLRGSATLDDQAAKQGPDCALADDAKSSSVAPKTSLALVLKLSLSTTVILGACFA